MKKISTILLAICCTSVAFSQESKIKYPSTEAITISYWNYGGNIREIQNEKELYQNFDLGFSSFNEQYDLNGYNGSFNYSNISYFFNGNGINTAITLKGENRKLYNEFSIGLGSIGNQFRIGYGGIKEETDKKSFKNYTGLYNLDADLTKVGYRTGFETQKYFNFFNFGFSLGFDYINTSNIKLQKVTGYYSVSEINNFGNSKINVITENSQTYKDPNYKSNNSVNFNTGAALNVFPLKSLAATIQFNVGKRFININDNSETTIIPNLNIGLKYYLSK